MSVTQWAPATGDMVWVPGATFWMGSDRHYREEAPTRQVTVGGFWIDPCPVINAQFAWMSTAARR